MFIDQDVARGCRPQSMCMLALALFGIHYRHLPEKLPCLTAHDPLVESTACY